MALEGINFVWDSGGFGNALILAHLTKICVDNGLPAVFTEHKNTVGLVDVPLYNESLHKNYFRHTWKGVRNTHYRKNTDVPAILQYIENVEDLFDTRISINERHNHIPVTYYHMKEVPYLDVVMGTITGRWSMYRNWPHFEKLKAMFDQEGITYIDMNKENIYSVECLNYVNKAKLFIGLETGMSHYVSKYANNKTLILQSGFCPFTHWAFPYKYRCLMANTECNLRPCFLDMKLIKSGVVCQNNHSCMIELTADRVFEKAISMI